MLLCILITKKPIEPVNLPLFIARRIAQKSTENRPSVMVRIATIAVALSLAVMLISMAVILGFKEEVSRKIIGFAADIELCDVRAIRGGAPYPITYTTKFEALIRANATTTSLCRFASRQGIIRGEESIEGVLLKGIGTDYDTTFLASILEEGMLPRCADSLRSKELLLSRTLAQRLDLTLGEKVELLFIESDGTPRRDRFKVTGIYHSGMEEVDLQLIYTDLRNVQRLNGWSPDEISGYEVRLTEDQDSFAITENLNRDLLYATFEEAYNVVASDITERYPMMFDWLITHDVNAAVILSIMFIVALFNMISVLLILVLERTRMIGLLKALGMENRTLRHLFLYRALFLILKGALWGNGVALILSLAQKWGHFLKLDSAGYLLSEVPIAFDLGAWIGINGITILLILLILALPASIVGRIRPEETIRYE